MGRRWKITTQIQPTLSFLEPKVTMASVLSLVVSGLLAASVNAQNYGSGGREGTAFSYVQPLNTTILGPYGHSPAVLPSRMFIYLTLCKQVVG